MDRRIYGIETEFGLAHSAPGARPLPPEEAARRLFAPVVAWGRSSNVFLPNGGRLYLDVGSHPEYATAECATLEDLVAQDKAGELILDDLRRRAEHALAVEGVPGSLYLFKNNVDSRGNSFGSHENYLIARRTGFPRLLAVLIPFLVTRQLLVGAGKLHPTGPEEFGTTALGTPGTPSYSFSQRADHIWEASSSATTRSRPLINTRDEPHADPQHHRRLHVIVGDSTMSQTTTALRIGTTDLVLRMIEAGRIMPDRTLADPVRALREISHDLTGTTRVALADGSRRSALDLQREHLEAARDFVDREGAHHDRVPWVLDLWERGLEAVARRDASGVDTELDWAIKRRLLDDYAARHGLDEASPRLAQLDLAYHDTAPGRGLFDLLERRGLAARFVPAERVEAATRTPPPTRAAVRGRFVEAVVASGHHYTVDWVHLKVNDRAQRTVVCQDPFAAVSAEADALIDSLRPAGAGPDAPHGDAPVL
ncbi:Pup--protein ligase [Kocuria sp. LUK]|uniref:Pup--protein ligase n=1 Tax=Kocuria sp. LUK TaxID=2897828 RepID=UPI001E5A050E|nr:Pup--protein ligase [Kocuria sp. LUK]MCD1143821.1 Pup--protein ligase [Kocuria sp. LUK]